MSKIAFISSPFFFGLFFLVLIAFISEHGGGVRGQPTRNFCSPGTGTSFGQRIQEKTCSGCDDYCKSLALPGNSPPSSGVKSGTCLGIESLQSPVPQNVCICCVI
ncbi:hypothetical protein MKW92_038894 [Papaver armeniacum]|nr:hypothetical protein MKW92_038894 [Papaver armeniacum]